MKSLYLRIWLTVVTALALFALVSGWMWQRHFERERVRVEAAAGERLAAWAELVQRSLPPGSAPVADQADALADWSQRLRVPMALDDARGQRIAASDSYQRREANGALQASPVRLDDGRTLWLARRPLRPINRDPAGQRWITAQGQPQSQAQGQAQGLGDPSGPGEPPGLRGPGRPPLRLLPGDTPAARPDGLSLLPPGHEGVALRPTLRPLPLFDLPEAVGPLILVALLFLAVAAGAYPVVRRLTRRLEALKQGVQAFGAGDLGQRVDATGKDEVAAVAATFNLAAERVQNLLRAHQSLLANASHELRSPLARLKMATTLSANLPVAQRAPLQKEIDANIAELDALVEEVLLASRLDGSVALPMDDSVDLLGLAAEEAARVGAEVDADLGAGRGMGTALPADLGTDLGTDLGADLGAGKGADPAAQAGSAGLVVSGNERLLRRSLRNLLENARRYGGGQVQVTLRREPAAGSSAHQSAAAQVAVWVCDRGPGVPDDQRERIFEPFFRLPGHAEFEGGVGLGLSLVRQIAQRHGGSVRCLARSGGGSCFVLSLPAA